ncbi:CCR4-associated factor [Musa troglodytarum]|uniref:CCR4-associated factor n=1 Tax=Musa troglodytarum TaxID=320322 RepID=A0A9E7EUM5_9LILI|nr:CCR4-associated factor [Musa troglodytarum]
MPSQLGGGGGGGPPYLVVRRVWAWNLEYEFSIIASLVDRFSYVAFDTEFPGLLYSTGRPHRLPRPACGTPSSRPTSTRWSSSNSASPSSTPSATSPTSAPAAGSGTCGSSTSGNSTSDATPTRRTPSTCSAPVASTSTGFPASALTPATSPPSSVVPASSPIAVSAARSPLDGSPFTAVTTSPISSRCWERHASARHPGRVPRPGELARRDCGSHMMFGCEGLSGGLESVASTLGVPRQAGKSHQAGSDSLVTYQVYLKMKRRFFNDRDATVARHRGIIYGLHAC